MPARVSGSFESQVVSLDAFRDTIATHNASTVQYNLGGQAVVVMLEDALTQFGCVSIDSAPDSNYPVDGLWHNVRHNLNAEFGPRRVVIRNGEFVVRHRMFEELVAGLLRVQYNALQYHKGREGTAVRRRSGAVASLHEHGVLLSWGAGRSLTEARAERRRRSRRYRVWR